MRLFYKILLNLCAIASCLVIFYAFQENHYNNINLFNNVKNSKQINNTNTTNSHFVYLQNSTTVKSDEYNVWCIFCKATFTSPIKDKLSVFAHSLVNLSTVPLDVHLITDDASQPVAEDVFRHIKKSTGKGFTIHYYDVKILAEELQSIIHTMQQHFTSQPDSYYSDVLFFISVGLHRIALNQTRAIMVDIDTKFKTDVKLLFDEFSKFGDEELLGIAPEQSPVYRHMLYMYRAKHRNTRFGKPLSQNGNPGVNSGVLLLQLSKIRHSQLYNDLLLPAAVKSLVDKYMFHGHLGDQDWYTLLSQEYKQLIHFLDCTWNRQLCQWWNHHGYKDIFNMFYICKGQVKIYHGNCNTRIP